MTPEALRQRAPLYVDQVERLIAGSALEILHDIRTQAGVFRTAGQTLQQFATAAKSRKPTLDELGAWMLSPSTDEESRWLVGFWITKQPAHVRRGAFWRFIRDNAKRDREIFGHFLN